MSNNTDLNPQLLPRPRLGKTIKRIRAELDAGSNTFTLSREEAELLLGLPQLVLDSIENSADLLMDALMAEVDDDSLDESEEPEQ